MRLYYLAFFALIILLGSGLTARPSCAGAVLLPGTGCDQAYWDSIGWRGWMEGKHDMESAQVIITKQYSVLEVSCFSESLASLARGADTMFSDNMTSNLLWANRTFNPLDPPYEPTINNNHTYSDILGGSGSIGYALLSATRMDSILQQAIGTGLNFYLSNNFTRPRVIGNAVPAPNGLCDTMNRMWNASRCDTYNRTTFYTFDEMLNTEPRANELYGCQFGAAPGTYFPRLRWDIAINGRTSPIPPYPYIAGAYPEPDTPAGSQPNTAGGMDATRVWLDALLGINPTTNASLCPLQIPIPTGVKAEVFNPSFNRTNPAPGVAKRIIIDDYVCLGFGCRFNYQTSRCQAN